MKEAINRGIAAAMPELITEAQGKVDSCLIALRVLRSERDEAFENGPQSLVHEVNFAYEELLLTYEAALERVLHLKRVRETVRQKYSPPSAASLRGDNGYQLFLAGLHTIAEAAASAGCSRMSIYRRLQKEKKNE